MAQRAFLILHGWQGSGPEHWQTWLAQRLREAGEQVAYPTLPDPDAPDPDAWVAALRAELEALGDARERTVVCHSLGCVLWLRHALDAAAAHRVERVLLVSPPCPCAGVDELSRWFPAARDAEAVARAAEETRIVCADTDEYCPEGALRAYGERLGVATDVIEGGGHLNTDAGYGPWPAVEAWCLEGTAPLTAKAALAA